MISRFNVVCPKCKEPIIIQSDRMGRLKQRVAILESVLRSNKIAIPDDSRNQKYYGGHLDKFLNICDITDVKVSKKQKKKSEPIKLPGPVKE